MRAVGAATVAAVASATGHALWECRGAGEVAGGRRAVGTPQGGAGDAGSLLGWRWGNRHGRRRLRWGRALRLLRTLPMLVHWLLLLLLLLLLLIRWFLVRALLLLVRSLLRHRLRWCSGCLIPSSRDLVGLLGLVKRALVGVEPANVGVLRNLHRAPGPRQKEQRRQRKTRTTTIRHLSLAGTSAASMPYRAMNGAAAAALSTYSAMELICCRRISAERTPPETRGANKRQNKQRESSARSLYLTAAILGDEEPPASAAGGSGSSEDAFEGGSRGWLVPSPLCGKTVSGEGGRCSAVGGAVHRDGSSLRLVVGKADKQNKKSKHEARHAVRGKRGSVWKDLDSWSSWPVACCILCISAQAGRQAGRQATCHVWAFPRGREKEKETGLKACSVSAAWIHAQEISRAQGCTLDESIFSAISDKVDTFLA